MLNASSTQVTVSSKVTKMFEVILPFWTVWEIMYLPVFMTIFQKTGSLLIMHLSPMVLIMIWQEVTSNVQKDQKQLLPKFFVQLSMISNHDWCFSSHNHDKKMFSFLKKVNLN